ncbi:G2/mitotic-specific cyclin-B2 [Anopheles aquasalis]|uniref:G2/mitotic-specific cyclin-B2 n=1 Tax=Anopheles aquasalis TaxID=42839 RepID=UPI00215AF354|nr:G2/mitotic-specific cyclin-B2 [Anopheles aquasalis]
MSRVIRIDENQGIGNVTEAIKKGAATKRPVLGELGNKVLRSAAQDLKGAANLKNANPGLKNVKPRVDTRWRKEENATVTNATKKPLGKSDSLKIAKNEEKTAPSKPGTKGQTQEAVRVHVQLNNGNEIKKVNLKREESHPAAHGQLAKANRKISTEAKNAATSGSSSSLDKVETVATSKQRSADTHSQKLLENIENIDKNDGWNPMLVSEYVNDIYKYLNRLESSADYALRENFLDGHTEVTYKMRAILIDWINEVHNQFKLDIDTYHMTVSLIDRYLQTVKTVPKKKLQLVGVTAMFIASKYEELFPPDIQDFVFITDDTYEKYQILEMEKEMVRALNFQMGKPLPTHFLRRFSKAAKASDLNHVLAKYLIELASVDYSTAHYKPSEIAAAALYISLFLFPLNNTGAAACIWNKTLEHYTHYTVQELIPIVQRLANVIKAVPEMAKKKLKATWLKYSLPKLQNISTHQKLGGSEIDLLAQGKLRL